MPRVSNPPNLDQEKKHHHHHLIETLLISLSLPTPRGIYKYPHTYYAQKFFASHQKRAGIALQHQINFRSSLRARGDNLRLARYVTPPPDNFFSPLPIEVRARCAKPTSAARLFFLCRMCAAPEGVARWRRRA